MQAFKKIHDEYITESVKMGIYRGASEENKMLMGMCDQLIRMAGGEKSREVMEEAYKQAVEV
jgi:hypothetical protein